MRKNFSSNELLGVPDPFEQPIPPSFDHGVYEPYFRTIKSAGSSRRVQTETYADLMHYEDVVIAARDLVQKTAYGSHLPMLQGDFRGTAYTREGEPYYVDALVNARRAYRRTESSTRSHESIKPSFFIHTIAVRELMQDIFGRPLQGPDDHTAYLIMASQQGAGTIGFYAITQDRNVAKAAHESVVMLCTKTSNAEPAHEALHHVFEEYDRKKNSPSALRVVWRGELMMHAFHDTGVQSSLEHDDSMDDASPLSWEKRAEAFVETKKLARTQKGLGTPTPMTFGFHGFFPSRRSNDARMREYVDEIISARPGGVFLYTRAVPEGHVRGKFLSSRAAIDRYIMTIGNEGNELTLVLNTRSRAKVNKFHLRLLELLPENATGQAIKNIVRRARKEFAESDNPDDHIYVEILH